ncbi:class III bacteriocin [Lactobacillus helveticus]|nr:class III bacteriocin [Lactobacillus helveticus]NRN98707.1 hypothetical protein [Lactobacillus helveticus]NRO87654.1 hypothetical protein [Lactobacillus helveticus]
MFNNMKQAYNISTESLHILNNYNNGDDDLYHVVVQKGNVGSRYLYALQLLNEGNNIYVFRGDKSYRSNFDKNSPVLRLIRKEKNDSTYYTAGGHTQTWEYAYANKNEWFVGTKPNDLNPSAAKWTKQIARVTIPQNKKIKSNTELPRLSNLNYAGSSYGIGYSGNKMFRVEAAVPLDHNYFMVITGDNANNAYFSIYSLSAINNALDSNGTSPVDIRNYASDCKDAFKISNLSGSNGLIGSLQGFDFSYDEVTNQGYIYISSQYSPNDGDGGESRKIVKIPWRSTDPSEWEEVDLRTNLGTLDEDAGSYRTELEGIQLIDNNDVYLTVAYHDPSQGNLTVMNRIYRVTWSSSI